MTSDTEQAAAGRRTGGADLDALLRAIRAVGGFRDLVLDDLRPMRVKGLVHAHVRLAGTGHVLRIPRAPLPGRAAAASLDYQAACFRRASASGAAPRFRALLPPADGMPCGALVVEEIDGTPPRLPDDMEPIAGALAAIHALPVPPIAARPPLPSHDDPVAATLGVIEAQAALVPDAGIGPDAAAQILEELERARGFAADADGRPHPVTLAGTDTHPGNFLVTSARRAVFVDLEKTLYGSPAIDLAHATVYTSTMWDADVATALSPDEIEAFHTAYFAAVPAALADAIRPWVVPMRRFIWLRTTTWAAKWRVESGNGEKWVAAGHDAAYMAAVRARIDDYLDPATIARVREGFREA